MVTIWFHSSRIETHFWKFSPSVIILLLLTYLINSIGAKARFNNAKDVAFILQDIECPFANKDTAHWIVFADADAAGYEEGARLFDIFNELQNVFKNFYATAGVINNVQISDEESDHFGEIITKLIEGRYSYDVLH